MKKYLKQNCFYSEETAGQTHGDSFLCHNNIPFACQTSQGFKWFGSLTNLSFRRSTEKSEKSSQSKSGAGAGSVSAHGIDCGTSNILTPVAETTVDDMDAMRPRTASYVRSSESYTHVGTLPRLLTRKRDKSNKGKAVEVMINTYSKLINFLFLSLVFMFMCDALSSLGGSNSSKKNKDKGSINRSQSQRPAGDKNCGPQKLTANSSKVNGDEAVGKADTGFNQDSLSDPKAQPEPAGGSTVTNTQNSFSKTTSGFEDVSPSCGSSAALQPDAHNNDVVTKVDADLNPEETSAPPLIQGNDQSQTHEDDGSESVSVSKPEVLAESREQSEGAKKGNQNSDSIYMWVLIRGGGGGSAVHFMLQFSPGLFGMHSNLGTSEALFQLAK